MCYRTCSICFAKKIKGVCIKNIDNMILKCQRMALLGTTKTVKVVLKLHSKREMQFILTLATHEETDLEHLTH